MHNVSEEIKSALSEIQKGFEPKPAHWIGSHPDGDSGEDYCRDCCEKAIGNLESGKVTDGKSQLTEEQVKQVKDETPFIDGGWSSEKDVIPRCSDCGVILIANMTSTAIEEELWHYESIDGDIVITSPEEAYDLDELLDSSENGAYADRINAIINRVVVKISHLSLIHI